MHSDRDTQRATGETAGDLTALLGRLDRDIADVMSAVTSYDDGVGMAAISRLLAVSDRCKAAAVEASMGMTHRGVISDEGITSDTYLRMHGGRTAAETSGLGYLVERLVDMPALRRWFRDGEVSDGVVRDIAYATRNLTKAQRAWIDQTLGAYPDRIRDLGADDLVGAVARLADDARPDLHADRERRGLDGRRLFLQPRIDGTGGEVHGNLDAEGFETLHTALDSYHPDATTDGDEDGEFGPRDRNRRGISRRHGEALVKMAEHRNADVCPANNATHDCATAGCHTTTEGTGETEDVAATGDSDGIDPTIGDSDDTAAGNGPADRDLSSADDPAPALSGEQDDGDGPAGSDGYCGACGHRRPSRRVGWAPSQAQPSIMVGVDISALADPDHPHHATARLLTRSAGGPVRLTPAAVDRLICQGTLRLVFRDGHEVIGVSPTVQKIPASLRHMVITRDIHCRFPGCQASAQACDIHHLIPRYEDGRTELGNLALICPQHHHAIHDGGWTGRIDPHDDSITFTRRGVTRTSLPDSQRHLTPTGPAPTGRPTRRRRQQRGSPPTHTGGSPPEPERPPPQPAEPEPVLPF